MRTISRLGDDLSSNISNSSRLMSGLRSHAVIDSRNRSSSTHSSHSSASISDGDVENNNIFNPIADHQQQETMSNRDVNDTGEKESEVSDASLSQRLNTSREATNDAAMIEALKANRNSPNLSENLTTMSSSKCEDETAVKPSDISLGERSLRELSQSPLNGFSLNETEKDTGFMGYNLVKQSPQQQLEHRALQNCMLASPRGGGP